MSCLRGSNPTVRSYFTRGRGHNVIVATAWITLLLPHDPPETSSDKSCCPRLTNVRSVSVRNCDRRTIRKSPSSERRLIGNVSNLKLLICCKHCCLKECIKRWLFVGCNLCRLNGDREFTDNRRLIWAEICVVRKMTPLVAKHWGPGSFDQLWSVSVVVVFNETRIKSFVVREVTEYTNQTCPTTRSFTSGVC